MQSWAGPQSGSALSAPEVQARAVTARGLDAIAAQVGWGMVLQTMIWERDSHASCSLLRRMKFWKVSVWEFQVTMSSVVSSASHSIACSEHMGRYAAGHCTVSRCHVMLPMLGRVFVLCSMMLTITNKQVKLCVFVKCVRSQSNAALGLDLHMRCKLHPALSRCLLAERGVPRRQIWNVCRKT